MIQTTVKQDYYQTKGRKRTPELVLAKDALVNLKGIDEVTGYYRVVKVGDHKQKTILVPESYLEL